MVYEKEMVNREAILSGEELGFVHGARQGLHDGTAMIFQYALIGATIYAIAAFMLGPDKVQGAARRTVKKLSREFIG